MDGGRSQRAINMGVPAEHSEAAAALKSPPRRHTEPILPCIERRPPRAARATSPVKPSEGATARAVPLSASRRRALHRRAGDQPPTSPRLLRTTPSTAARRPQTPRSGRMSAAAASRDGEPPQRVPPSWRVPANKPPCGVSSATICTTRAPWPARNASQHKCRTARAQAGPGIAHKGISCSAPVACRRRPCGRLQGLLWLPTARGHRQARGRASLADTRAGRPNLRTCSHEGLPCKAHPRQTRWNAG